MITLDITLKKQENNIVITIQVNVKQKISQKKFGRDYPIRKWIFQPLPGPILIIETAHFQSLETSRTEPSCIPQRIGGPIFPRKLIYIKATIIYMKSLLEG